MSTAAEELPVRLREMLPRDVAAVGRIESNAYHYPWSTRMFRDCLLAGYTCLVLESDQALVGYGIMSIAAAEAHVLNVCVRPSKQGCGHGRRLMEALLQRARQAGGQRAFLEVRPSNTPALNLYQTLGFREIGVRPRYYQAATGREDAVVLCAELQAPAAER